MDQIAAWFDRHDITYVTLLLTIALLIGAAVIIPLVRRLLQAWLRRLAGPLHLPYETSMTIARVVSGALWLIVALLVLGTWGVSVGGVWTLLVSAAALIGVGFLATWTMVSNVTASLFIAIWRPFHLGDTVEILPENLSGRVVDHNLMFVVLREDKGTALKIPNNLFFQKVFRVTDGDRSLFEALEPSTDVARREHAVSVAKG